jgi:class 3 adenylate cyclase
MSDEQPSPRTALTGVTRKLAAILAADVQGYSWLMGEDEVATLLTLTASRQVTDALIARYHGRIVNTAGDSILAEFASVVDAVQCAVDIQHELTAKNEALSASRRMEFRIGINLGDVMVEGEQIYGDGVNIAARLESLADGGGICIAGNVYEQIRHKLALPCEDLGEQTVKNIAQPIRVWRVKLTVPSLPVEQASSLHAARMAAPLEEQSEGGVREAESTRVKVQSAKTRSAWAIGTVAGLLLIAGTLVAVRYFSLPLFPFHSQL